MSKNMLEYTKTLLKKVSFDVKLFRKELAKAYQNLLDEEVEELKEWVLNNFGTQYYLNPIYVVK
ncbi:MAG: hypothetical protein KDD24_03495 [Flavobacteriales bacterium]|nr:hypothetical protein [Flavobacteriales bacterium]MCB9173348.1 hypothetical protein [Flavobacteriales bacterium]